jgi:hypothetical protein
MEPQFVWSRSVIFPLVLLANHPWFFAFFAYMNGALSKPNCCTIN